MNSDATLTRTVVDAGIELDITLPGVVDRGAGRRSVLAMVGGADEDETLDPEPAGHGRRRSRGRGGIHDCPQCSLGPARGPSRVRVTGRRGGHEALALGMSFRQPGTGAVQVENLFAVFVPGPDGAAGHVVRATATCGDAASEAVVARLAALVSSLSVRTVPGGGA